jgi:hypothetical protein
MREPEDIRHDCSGKLRVVQVRDHFRAILGRLIDQNGSMLGWIGLVRSNDAQGTILQFPKSMRLNRSGWSNKENQQFRHQQVLL